VWLANFIQIDAAVASFHIWSIFFQMGSADILQAIGLGATMLALNGGVVGNAFDAVIHSLHLKAAHVHFMSFDVTVHFSSFYMGLIPIIRFIYFLCIKR
jgi:hypothetical protein